MKQPPLDQARAQLLEQVTELIDTAKLLRDYATTPGNIWLAKNELSKSGQMLSDIQNTLENIKAWDESTDGQADR